MTRALPFYQVDAFTDAAFGGNPAAVVISQAPLRAGQMQAIAAENNLSETAFLVPRSDGDWDLRWFTPTLEVDLCGHATLGAARALQHRGDLQGRTCFHTASGVLAVAATGSRLEMDLPVVPVNERVEDPALIAALGQTAELWSVPRIHGCRYVLCRVANETAVRAATPDLPALRALETNVVLTAPGDGPHDVVSRFFAPGSGVEEDPVTGSAHCTLSPFWSGRLGRQTLHCVQASARGGELEATLDGDRVRLSGHAVVVIEGTLHAP
ncbi:MAG: PhzF family phenazine biosynthesis protein [Myxococcota bacterium]|nr:PhzF family phenazine biosynthesis protein [Myxococcota bacterium]